MKMRSTIRFGTTEKNVKDWTQHAKEKELTSQKDWFNKLDYYLHNKYKPISGIHWTWSYENDIDTQISKKLKEGKDEEHVAKMQLRSIMKKPEETSLTKEGAEDSSVPGNNTFKLGKSVHDSWVFPAVASSRRNEGHMKLRKKLKKIHYD